MKSPFTPGELEAVKLGILFEEKGVKLYTGMSNEAPHPLEKTFYAQLAKEGRSHWDGVSLGWSMKRKQ